MPPTTDQRLAARTPDGKAPLVFLQNWEHLLLLHWRVDPDLIQATLPPGLNVDTTEDSAWLSIVPFCMSWVRPRRLPALPFISHFLQLNVRTYVYDDEGRPGVWFYSLDCSSGPACWVARKFFKLPYFQARMKAAITDDVHYTCRRADRYGGAPYGSYRLSVYRYSGQGKSASRKTPSRCPFSCWSATTTLAGIRTSSPAARSPTRPTATRMPMSPRLIPSHCVWTICHCPPLRPTTSTTWTRSRSMSTASNRQGANALTGASRLKQHS